MWTRKTWVFETIFIFILLAIGFQLYILPVLTNPGKIILFSDDAVYAILARRTLQIGLQGAFHLNWSPLFPWTIALLYKFFGIAFEDGGLVITSFAIVLRIIPAYLISRTLFGKVSAIFTAILLMGAPLIKVSFEFPMTETLTSLIILSAIFIFTKALKEEQSIWYILGGFTLGLSYLTRLESWILIVPLIFLSLTKLVSHKESIVKTLIHIVLAIVSFLVTSFPYIYFMHDALGIWTLNGKAPVYLSNLPTSIFGLYQDRVVGLTTPAEIFYSGKFHMYSAGILHPSIFEVLLAFYRGWSSGGMSGVLINYLKLLQSNIPSILILGSIGLLIAFILASKNLKNMILSLTLFTIIFFLLDFSIRYIGFFLYRGSTTLKDLINLTFVRHQFPPQFTFRDLAIVTIGFVILRRQKLRSLLNSFYQNRSLYYLFFSFGIGLIPLVFVNASLRYTNWEVCILTIYSGFAIKYFSSNLLKLPIKTTLEPQKSIVTSILIGLFLTLWVSYPLYTQSQFVKEQKYYSELSDAIRKKPGLAILADHGPGAKIADFYEATAFYAQGETFYIPSDGDKISPQETLDYLNQNTPDYVVAVKYGAYEHTGLQPFYNSNSKISGWKPIYQDPGNNAETSIIVWKRV